MIQFEVNQAECIRCGQCAQDCPVKIIDLQNGYPEIPARREAKCYRCQHCLAICPTGAISILGLNPADSIELAGNLPQPEQLETLIKGRRSVRRYHSENLEPELIRNLLEVAWHAPTGVNARQVRFTVIDDGEALARFRDEVYEGLAGLVREQKLPKNRAFFADFLRLWRETGEDVLFRGAPHLLVASAPRSTASPLPDCLIALAYFELYAQSKGVGTVWNGLVRWTIDDMLPRLRKRLAIPADHQFGYCMSFGRPAVSYRRTVQHAPAEIVRFDPGPAPID
jgi:nitroreductase/NAD-dependent dihydropyrimidine dehydrogenase PreA subunit